MTKQLINIMLVIGLLVVLNGPIFPESKNTSPDQVFNSTGIGYLQLKDYNKAISAFSDAIKINAANKYYHNNIAAAYMKLWKYTLAYKHLKKAIALDKHYIKALSNMAIVCFKLGQYQQSYNYYIKAENIDQLYTKNRFNRNKLIKELRTLVKKNPGNHQYHQMLNYVENKP